MLYISLRNKLIAILLFISLPSRAWDWWPLPMAEPDTCKDSIYYVGSIKAVASTGTKAPYLMYANTYGDIATSPYSGNLCLGICKPATRPNRWFDYDGAVVLSGRLQSTGSTITGYFNQLYAHARLYIVDITIGIRPVQYGMGLPDLSMGNLLFSANSHPIPRITIGIDQWTAFPGLYGYLEVKGGMTHGWMDDNNPYVSKTLLHHKFIGGRIGGRLPINISYEFHHAAQWGGYSSVYGDLGNSWSDFTNVLMIRSGGNSKNEMLNKQGNHIGFQQLGVTAKGKDWHLDLYWQYINEDSPVKFIGWGRNNKDGLWGACFEQTRWPFIQAFTIEFANTTDQSGPFHDRDGIVYGGNDDYFKNGIYCQGWTYFGQTIGTPIITQTNNRVMAGYIGIKGDIYGYRYRIASQYARNWGRYLAPESSHNTALMMEITKNVKKAWGLDFGIRLAGDIGNQWGNSFGAMIVVQKKGLITSW